MVTTGFQGLGTLSNSEYTPVEVGLIDMVGRLDQGDACWETLRSPLYRSTWQDIEECKSSRFEGGVST